MKTKLTIVEGTWGGDWAQPGSEFRQLLEEEDIEVCEPPFVWSGDVAGIWRPGDNGRDSDWRAGGYAFGLRMQQIPFEDRIVLAHSYGGNCVAFGLLGPTAVPIRRLITVGTPNRHDMDPVWAEAVKRIGHWAHFHDPKVPMIERFAQVFDGKWDWPWNAKTGQKHAHRNVPIKGMGHTKVLDDPAFTKGDGMLIGYLKSPDLLPNGLR
jgi:hypothetical protein